MNDKTVIVTGAAGFTGFSLTQELSEHGYTVYAVVRPNSAHNHRITSMANVIPIGLDAKDILQLPEIVNVTPFAMIHLVWRGGRYSIADQKKNIEYTMNAIEVAHCMGCRRFLCTGSQAEYGATSNIQTEDMVANPFCAYGSAKAAAHYLSRYRAKELEIDWIWGRIFSLYGLYEPRGRMLPDAIRALRTNECLHLSSCRQNWDYLYVKDAALAIIALIEKGKAGETYNIANGSFRPLKDYVEDAKEFLKSNSEIIYGDDPSPFVSLQPSIKKIQRDTGWMPKVQFLEGLAESMRISESYGKY